LKILLKKDSSLRMKLLSLLTFQEYLALTKSEACHPDVWVNLACCYFLLGMYKESDEMAEKGNRL